MTDAVRSVEIRGESITLVQLLKFAGLTQTGGEARNLLASGAVKVNGAGEERRGRKLADGDVVYVESHAITLRIVTLAKNER